MLRDNFGYDIELLVDENQGFTVEEAITKCEEIEVFSLAWIEEPLKGDQDHELEYLARKISIPIASGENRLTCESVMTLFDVNDAFIQPDIVRCGGISTISKIKQQCDLSQKCLATHLNPEYAVSILPACKRSKIEFPDFYSSTSQYFTHDFSIRNGMVDIPKGPGTNVRLRKDVIDKYKYY